MTLVTPSLCLLVSFVVSRNRDYQVITWLTIPTLPSLTTMRLIKSYLTVYPYLFPKIKKKKGEEGTGTPNTM